MSKVVENIIGVSENLFYEFGFNGTGVNLIRDEANCSKTTMYKKFGNKDNLTVIVLRERDKKFRDSLKSYIGENVRDYEAVSKIFLWHKEWFETVNYKGCLFVRASYELQNKNEEVYKVISEHKTWIRDLFEERLSSKFSQDGIPEVLATLLEGLISFNTIYRNNNDFDAYLESCLRVVEFIMVTKLPKV